MIQTLKCLNDPLKIDRGQNYASSQLDAARRKSREFERAGQCGKVLGEESRISPQARKYNAAVLVASAVPIHPFVTPAAFAILVEMLITVAAPAFFGQLLNSFKQLQCSRGSICRVLIIASYGPLPRVC